MSQVPHDCARATEAVRRAIQLQQEGVKTLARRYGVSFTTVQKWRKRTTTADVLIGPKDPRSIVLTPEQEAIIVAFRRHTLLPLDDCFYALHPTIPQLMRSTLHRCLEQHGISRLPQIGGDKPIRQRFAAYLIGYFHIDLAEVSSGRERLRLFVAIDRTSKFAFICLVPSAGQMAVTAFLRELIEATSYCIHTVLTDNCVPFTPRKQDIWDTEHIFDRVCRQHGIENRITNINHPWTNGQVERMNRTIKNATLKRYHYDTHEQLRSYLQLFVNAYNHARRLMSLRGLTLNEFVHQIWTKEPERFRINPSRRAPVSYTLSDSVPVSTA